MANSAAAVTTKAGKPTPGVRPNFTGVASVFVKLAEVPPELVFSARKQRTSPYDEKLRALLEAGRDTLLKFDDPRARASLSARSKKLGMKLEYGEHMGKLYVRLAPGSTAAPAAQSANPLSVKDTVAASDKTRKRSLIITAIRQGKHTPEAIAAFMRQEHPDVDAPIVRSMLKQMQNDGSVTLAKISPETWELAA